MAGGSRAAGPQVQGAGPRRFVWAAGGRGGRAAHASGCRVSARPGRRASVSPSPRGAGGGGRRRTHRSPPCARPPPRASTAPGGGSARPRAAAPRAAVGEPRAARGCGGTARRSAPRGVRGHGAPPCVSPPRRAAVPHTGTNGDRRGRSSLRSWLRRGPTRGDAPMPPGCHGTARRQSHGPRVQTLRC